VAAAEIYAPGRPKASRWKERWRINLSLLVFDVVVQRLSVGALALVAAQYASEQGLGLFAALHVPPLLAGLIGFLVLDFAVWAQHVLTHKLPVLWQLHQVHHADDDVDLTTGLRFHPVEIVLSAVYKAGVVLALGIDPWTVLAFEVVLNASSVYTHGNVHLPKPVERVLRMVFCTPDMHRVHHSVVREETDSNYGFFLSIWDRLFGTFRQEPKAGQMGVELGLPQFRTKGRLGFVKLLGLPFQ
jgi:sterol desaturase/sphingolipid hydroxylase (fatty acid hydroxylase superfamily)